MSDDLTLDELGALAEALDDIKAGRMRPLDDIKKELDWRTQLELAGEKLQ
jgi:hypothetical protein